MFHSALNFVQVVSIQVAINSSNNMLFPVLISSNFAEIKTIVFKFVSRSGLFQIVCGGILIRFIFIIARYYGKISTLYVSCYYYNAANYIIWMERGV